MTGQTFTTNLNTMLKPNGISHTVYPERPAKDYNEWMQHITNGTVQNVVDDYHEKFNQLWQALKLDVQRNTKKHA